MSSKSEKTRQEQLKHFELAVSQRIAFLKAKISEQNLLEKDPVLRHLKGRARQVRRSLNAISDLKTKKVPLATKEEGKKKKAGPEDD